MVTRKRESMALYVHCLPRYTDLYFAMTTMFDRYFSRNKDMGSRNKETYTLDIFCTDDKTNVK